MKIQKLTIDQIVDKEFDKKKIGGVSKEDVDDFLNIIIEDYEYFIESINNLKEVNEQLRDENFKIKMNVLKNNTSNLDVEELKENEVEVKIEKKIEPEMKIDEQRISALEKAISELKEQGRKWFKNSFIILLNLENHVKWKLKYCN
ncbi:MAG: DivIVA domain-containing protein [Mycoplasmatales bacterium]